MAETENSSSSDVDQKKKLHRSVGRKSFWRINHDTVPYKLQYFLFFGSMGTFYPYLSAIGINRFGLTASNLAAVLTVTSIFCIIFKPVNSYFVDYFNQLKGTIIGLIFIQVLFCFLMITIPKTNVKNFSNATRNNISQGELNMCHFCSYHQEFKNFESIMPQLNFEGEFYERTLRCLETFGNKTNHTAVFSSKPDKLSSHSYDFLYKIIYQKHKSTFRRQVILFKNATGSKEIQTDMHLTALSLNDSQLNTVICLHSKNCESCFASKNVKLTLLVDHAYPTINEEYIPLEILCNVPSVLGENISCNTIYLIDVPFAKDEQNTILSAEVFRTYQFWLFGLSFLVNYFCINSVFILEDTACSENVHKIGADFGQQRAWGPISWGLFSALAGYLNDSMNSYVASWCVMTLLCSLMAWSLCKMDLTKPNFTRNSCKDLKAVLSSSEFLAFDVGMFFNGIFTGIIDGYLVWFIISIGGNDFIIGLGSAIQCVIGEVPSSYFAGCFIEHVGHFNVVSSALFTHGLRFLLYSYIYDPWWILPVECLHGITFGFLYPVMTSFAKLKCKPGTEATTVSVLYTIFDGIGNGLGYFLSGICFEKFGSHTTFFYSSFLCILATGVNILSTILLRSKKDKQKITDVNAMKLQLKEHC